jgi:hypothetical protein
MEGNLAAAGLVSNTMIKVVVLLVVGVGAAFAVYRLGHSATHYSVAK